jgi:hypothetical protein
MERELKPMLFGNSDYSATHAHLAIVSRRLQSQKKHLGRHGNHNDPDRNHENWQKPRE